VQKRQEKTVCGKRFCNYSIIFLDRDEIEKNKMTPNVFVLDPKKPKRNYCLKLCKIKNGLNFKKVIVI
jgi:hypothetical protein